MQYYLFHGAKISGLPNKTNYLKYNLLAKPLFGIIINNAIMENTVNERIAMIISNFGYKSKRSFAEKIGVAQTSLNDVLNGAEPKYSTLSKILKAEPLVSAEWLMRGEGEMCKKQPLLHEVKFNEVARVNNEFILLKEHKLEGPERNVCLNLHQIVSIEDRVTTSVIRKSDGESIEVKCPFEDIVNCLNINLQ